MNLRSRMGLTAGLLVGLASCGGPSSMAGDLKPVSNAEAFEGVQCSAVRPQTEPDLMAWDSGSRLNLKRLRGEGVVAVRYEANGCNVKLELLSGCVADGKYAYTPYSANETKVAHNASELYSQLPLGAASLTGKVKGDRALRTDYALAGQYSLPAKARFAASDLQGVDCARATHVVRTMYVGGFALVSGESREIDAAVSVFNVGAGASNTASAERLAREGNAEACEKAQINQEANGNCDVPLRIGLLAIDGVQPEQAAVSTASSPASSKSAEGMVRIPAGTFTMGASNGNANEAPAHSVTVEAFDLDRTEVTVQAYEACVKAGQCEPSDHDASCNAGKTDKRNHPINCVDWKQASTYCEWAGKRLPSEEEWEYAARGTDGRKFPWGNEAIGARACWNRQSGTCAVGSFTQGASPFDVLDMAGNVSEWTSSGYSESHDKVRVTTRRVNRGGGWGDGDANASNLRASFRSGGVPSFRLVDLGFRCAK